MRSRRTHPVRILSFLISWLCFFAFSAQCGPVRISFLNDEKAVRKTVDFLRAAGCQKEGIELFRKAIERYNSVPLNLDLQKFPRPKAGFYKFDSMTNLLSVLPHFWKAEHSPSINCFDGMILLTTKRLKTSLSVDSPAGPFLINHTLTNGITVVEAATTAQDACTLLYPPWYQEITYDFFPMKMAKKRLCLTAALFNSHVLPSTTSSETIANTLLSALQSGWEKNGIEFPENCEVILWHWVNLKIHIASTMHVGVLFKSRGQNVYIEKSGITGPFFRLDSENLEDVTAYLEARMAIHLQDDDYPENIHYFATFNNTGIKKLRVERIAAPVIEKTTIRENLRK